MIFKPFVRFIGGLPFALLLIGTTALFAIAGTIVESATESHRYAAYFTYDNPFFILLLWGFFLNILVSALRRYPFQKHHIPFLLTHLGMLMILGGMFVKSRHGLQGTMSLIEGSGSDQVFFPGTYAIRVDHHKMPPRYFTLNDKFPRHSKLKAAHNEPSDLEITLLDSSQHSHAKWEAWIKGKHTSFFGISPCQVQKHSDALPQYALRHLPQAPNKDFHILALECTDLPAIIKKAYFSKTTAIVSDTRSDMQLFRGPLSEIISQGIQTDYGHLSGELLFSWDVENGFDSPLLKFNLASEAQEEITVALSGPQALLNRNSKPHLGKSKVTIDLEMDPTLLLLKSDADEIALLAFGEFGQAASAKFKDGELQGVMAYDQGYQGYSYEVQLPNILEAQNRKQREAVQLNKLKQVLKTAAEEAPDQLIFPLKLLLETCQACECDFAETTIAFLAAWDKQGGWLYHPNVSSHQLMAQELSLHFRGYGLHLSSLLPPIDETESWGKPLTLETPLMAKQDSLPPLSKLEENKPCIALRFKQGRQEEVISLGYDSFASGLKWPIFNGEYLVRFQPLFQQIPYRLRLRQARQLNYMHTTQPHSFEADLIILNAFDGHSNEVEASISMNNVYETWDGYRFYLANIAPSDSGSLKRVQIVVNRDPAKHYLTYPGALCMVMGILLLFFGKRK